MITMETPNMVELLLVASRARADEKEQYKVLFGREWDKDQVANECFNRTGIKFVFLDDKKPFCVGGWEPVIDGVWQSWMIGDMKYWETHWRTITKMCLKTMDIMFEGGARRLQTMASVKRTKTCEWYIKGLKMSQEGIFRNFGMNGEDIAMFSKIKE